MKKVKPLSIFLVVLCFVAAYFLFYSSTLFSFTIDDEPERITKEDISKKEVEVLAPVDPVAPGRPAANQLQESSAHEDEETGPESAVSQGVSQITFPYQSLVDELSFLQSPLPGAKISARDSQLPGAPRAYRNGTHEGLDYYNGYCGVPINFSAPVFAAGAGVVERIDHDYKELDFNEREKMLKVSAAEGDTPEDILDMLRGRQVWIKHPSGIITRYAHLSQVSEKLQTGDQVEAGDFLGRIGNSGTSDGAKGNTANAHLHFEIWLDPQTYLGKDLSPAEVREILQKVLE